jgi:hypothetical protein
VLRQYRSNSSPRIKSELILDNTTISKTELNWNFGRRLTPAEKSPCAFKGCQGNKAAETAGFYLCSLLQ